MVVFSVSESFFPTVTFSLLESIRCHSTDEYLVYGTEDEVSIGNHSTNSVFLQCSA